MKDETSGDRSVLSKNYQRISTICGKVIYFFVAAILLVVSIGIVGFALNDNWSSFEAIVLVFAATKANAPESSVFPVFLLLISVAIVIGLGIFQWLSAQTEALSRKEPKAAEQS